MLEHQAREHTVPLEGEIAASHGQFAAGEVPSLGEALLAELEGGKHEEVRALVIPRLAHPDPVHDAIAEGQFGHRTTEGRCER